MLRVLEVIQRRQGIHGGVVALGNGRQGVALLDGIGELVTGGIITLAGYASHEADSFPAGRTSGPVASRRAGAADRRPALPAAQRVVLLERAPGSGYHGGCRPIRERRLRRPAGPRPAAAHQTLPVAIH